MMVNNMPLHLWCSRSSLRYDLIRPFVVTGTLGKFRVWAKVRGGGNSGQCGAIRLGIARCLVGHNAQYKTLLKEEKLLTRDPRMVERKKPGKAKARKSFQWVKR